MIKKLTEMERDRIKGIRASLERNRGEWWVDMCESTFFIRILDRLGVK